MGKYSSDSESDKRSSSYRSKTKHKSSSSSSSSDSRRKRRREKSRDRYGRSSLSRSTSTQKSKSKYKNRHRDDEYHRSRSSSKSKHTRSRSKSYIREYVSRPRKRSTSSSSSSDVKREVVEKSSSVKTEFRKSPEVSKLDSKTLDAINDDAFTPKAFISSKSKKVMENIVIDLKKQTIKVPEVDPVEPDSIFHHNLFSSEEVRLEKWIKELYGFRQKALLQGLKSMDRA